MFPTRIRYTGMSLPYHIGNGWFGGLLPATVFALSAAKGDIYYGLWYPIVVAAMSLVIGMLFVRDTLGTDLRQGIGAPDSAKSKPGPRKRAGLFCGRDGIDRAPPPSSS